MNTAAETIVHDDSDDIPVFSLESKEKTGMSVQMKDETNNKMDFTERQYSDQEALLSAHETETKTQFDPIELDEVIHKQLTDPFCVEACRKRNEGGEIGLRGR